MMVPDRGMWCPRKGWTRTVRTRRCGRLTMVWRGRGAIQTIVGAAVSRSQGGRCADGTARDSVTGDRFAPGQARRPGIFGTCRGQAVCLQVSGKVAVLKADALKERSAQQDHDRRYDAFHTFLRGGWRPPLPRIIAPIRPPAIGHLPLWPLSAHQGDGAGHMSRFRS